MELRPIPAFYCCYLLRSRPSKGPPARKSRFYIGSTPNPARRLAQHNAGREKGGAARTSGSGPWDMVCIVTGFPSSLAALQFEWTWQNPHTTRRISDSQRVKSPAKKGKTSKKTGKVRNIIQLQNYSLPDRLKHLHLLLRVPSFSRWPLEVRFFSTDIYQTWQKWLGERSSEEENLRDGINVVLDLRYQPSTVQSESEEGGLLNGVTELDATRNAKSGVQPPNPIQLSKGQFEGMDVGYGPLKTHIEKSQFLLASGEIVYCAVCKQQIQTTEQLAVVCPSSECRSASHLRCLSTEFLRQEGSSNGGAIIPLQGRCPSCHSPAQWVDLVKELTLRMRGEKEVARLMKKRRVRKVKAEEVVVPDTDGDDEDDLELGDDADAGESEEEEEQEEEEHYEHAQYDDEMDAEDVVDVALIQEDVRSAFVDDDHAVSTKGLELVHTSSTIPHTLSSPHKAVFRVPRGMEIVIEDSEFEGEELSDLEKSGKR